MNQIMPDERIESKIYVIRGRKVMLDADLAGLYDVATKRLVESVKRNSQRFPVDFMFQLNEQEAINLRSQIATSNWGGRRYLPYVFTEHGILMLSSVLKSERAIQVNIQIMRTFTKMRQLLASNSAIWKKISDLEGKYEGKFKDIFDILRELIQPPEKTKRPIGFMRDQ